MKILRLLASLLVMMAVVGCARQAKPGMPVAHPAPMRREAAINSLKTTTGLVCSNCHNALTVDIGAGPAIAFSHERHLNRGAHCNQCHIDLGHGTSGRIHGPGIRPKHPQCFACHDGKRASNKCEYCHLKRSQVNPHPPNFLSIHGATALKNPSSCRECHTESFCLNCHTLPMPHPRNWISIHGQELGQGDCARCHTQQYCDQCHQRTRPAPHQAKDFLKTHGSLATLGSNCRVCHSNQFCLNCHKLPMPHPSDWTSGHAGPGQTQTQACVRCHKLDECRTCHDKLKIMGHPTDFLMAHMAEGRKPNPDCRVCHAPSYCAECHPKGIDGKIFPDGK